MIHIDVDMRETEDCLVPLMMNVQPSLSKKAIGELICL